MATRDPPTLIPIKLRVNILTDIFDEAIDDDLGLYIYDSEHDQAKDAKSTVSYIYIRISELSALHTHSWPQTCHSSLETFSRFSTLSANE
jgi:hypothetical protein